MNTLLRGVMTAMPIIPYITRSRRRTSVGTYLLAGVGLAVFGGIAALMASPRTRHRTLDAAKDTFGKVNEKIGQLRPALRHAVTEHNSVSDGLAGSRDYKNATTGL